MRGVDENLSRLSRQTLRAPSSLVRLRVKIKLWPRLLSENYFNGFLQLRFSVTSCLWLIWLRDRVMKKDLCKGKDSVTLGYVSATCLAVAENFVLCSCKTNCILQCVAFETSVSALLLLLWKAEYLFHFLQWLQQCCNTFSRVAYCDGSCKLSCSFAAQVLATARQIACHITKCDTVFRRHWSQMCLEHFVFTLRKDIK